jgi:hypothetical protein
MQLPWDEHFHEIVIPAWQAYRAAERRLSEAVMTGDEEKLARAKYDALREGGAAAFYLHHYAEVVLRARPDWFPCNALAEARTWLAAYCTMLRSENPIADVSLLGDVADSLKHAILLNPAREVAANDAVLVVQSNFGQLGYGEGKYGGGLQVLVLGKSRPRALSSILQNVVDAWRRAARLPLPEIGAP